MLKDSLHTEDTWKAVIGEMLCGGPIYQYESILEPSDLAFTPEASEIFHCDGLMDPNKPLALKRKLGGGEGGDHSTPVPLPKVSRGAISLLSPNLFPSTSLPQTFKSTASVSGFQ